jgi:hypothetical protein
MREIKRETIDKYTRLLTVVKKQEGKELDLRKAIETFHLNSSAPYYARRLKFFDFDGTKILKVNYPLNEFDKVDPIHARRFIEGMYRLVKEDKNSVGEKKANPYKKVVEVKEEPVKVAMKTCTKCGNSFPATSEFFNKDRSKSDGLQCACKKCRASMSSKSKHIMDIPFKKPKSVVEAVNERRQEIEAITQPKPADIVKTDNELKKNTPEPKPVAKEKKGYVIRIFGLPLFGVERW